MILRKIRNKSSKNLFKKLQKHFKALQIKQKEIVKKHNSLASQYEELGYFKNDMNEYTVNKKTLEMQHKKVLLNKSIIRVKEDKSIQQRSKKKRKRKIEPNFILKENMV